MFKKIAILTILVAVMFASSGAAYAQGANVGLNSFTFGAVFQDEVKEINKDEDSLLLGGTIELFLGRNSTAFFAAELDHDEIVVPNARGLDIWLKFTPNVSYVDVDGTKVTISKDNAEIHRLNSREDYQNESFDKEVWIYIGDLPEDCSFLDLIVDISYVDFVEHKIIYIIRWTTDEEKVTRGKQRVGVTQVFGMGTGPNKIKSDFDLLQYCKGGRSPKFGYDQDFQSVYMNYKASVDELIRELKLDPEIMSKLSFNQSHDHVLSYSQRKLFLEWKLDEENGITVASSGLIWLVSAKKVRPTHAIKMFPRNENGEILSDAPPMKLNIFPLILMDGDVNPLVREEGGLVQYPVNQDLDCPAYMLDPKIMWQEKVISDGSTVYYYPIQGFTDRDTWFWVESAVIRFQGGEKWDSNSGKWFLVKKPEETLFLEIVSN